MTVTALARRNGVLAKQPELARIAPAVTRLTRRHGMKNKFHSFTAIVGGSPLSDPHG